MKSNSFETFKQPNLKNFTSIIVKFFLSSYTYIIILINTLKNNYLKLFLLFYLKENKYFNIDFFIYFLVLI